MKTLHKYNNLILILLISSLLVCVYVFTILPEFVLLFPILFWTAIKEHQHHHNRKNVLSSVDELKIFLYKEDKGNIDFLNKHVLPHLKKDIKQLKIDKDILYDELETELINRLLLEINEYEEFPCLVKWSKPKFSYVSISQPVAMAQNDATQLNELLAKIENHFESKKNR